MYLNKIADSCLLLLIVLWCTRESQGKYHLADCCLALTLQMEQLLNIGCSDPKAASAAFAVYMDLAEGGMHASTTEGGPES